MIPNLPANSVVVLDKAIYHSVQAHRTPTSNSRKDLLKEWLDSHGIRYVDVAIKIEIHE
jgi:hypothetical protein